MSAVKAPETAIKRGAPTRCGDGTVERHSLFWRFIALMELGRVAEAESVLALYERGAVAAGDGQQIAMATARHGMLAALRGQFDDVLRIADDVFELGRRSGLADDFRLAGTLRALVMSERDIPEMAAHEQIFREWSRRMPGHFAEADLTRMLALIGRHSDADAELERTLPRVLAGSGPRWIGAMSHLPSPPPRPATSPPVPTSTAPLWDMPAG